MPHAAQPCTLGHFCPNVKVIAGRLSPKCPRHVVFTELLKTGKIQKFKLREMAKAV